MSWLTRTEPIDEHEDELRRQIRHKHQELGWTMQPQARIAIRNEIYALGEEIRNYRRKNGASHE